MHSVDIEDVLRTAIGDSTLAASANPLPQGFQTPYALVTATGGDTVDIVIDRLRASVDVYAETWADAHTYAQTALERARGLQSAYRVEVDTLPYHNPDPRRPDLPRVTFNLTVTIRNIKQSGGV